MKTVQIIARAVAVAFAFSTSVTVFAQSDYSTPYNFTTMAGAVGVTGSSDGIGGEARFSYAFGVAVDGSGNVYLADSDNHTIRKITSAGVVTTFAGMAGGAGSTDGTGSEARFSSPTGLAVDAAGNVYVADYSNCTIRRITAAGEVTTLAGTPLSQGWADGTGSAAQFSNPWGIAVDGTGNVYVADVGTIRKITASGIVTTLAGTATSRGSTDGTGSAASFNNPNGLGVDSAGNIYVADTSNRTIRKVSTEGVVTTVAGSAGSWGSNDGVAASARFDTPVGVAVDESGNVFVTDRINNTIRKISAQGVVTTLAGLNRSSGSADGTGSAARFSQPWGLAIDTAGNLYVADAGNCTVRRGTMAPPSLTSASATSGMVGEEFSYELIFSGSPTVSSVSDLPAGLTYDAVNGVIHGTPASHGTFEVTISATNDAGTSSSILTLTVAANPLEVWSLIGVDEVTNGDGSMTFTAVVSDAVAPTYQWYRDRVVIPDADAESYTMSADDVLGGVELRVMVSQGGTSQSRIALGGAGLLWGIGGVWGGQMGDLFLNDNPKPIMADVAEIAAGVSSSYILKKDGTLWAFGSNTYGQLGNGTNIDRTSPVQVADNVKSVAAGYEFCLVIKTDGTLWTVGRNTNGALGDGTTVSRTELVQVETNVISAAAGRYHSLFLKADGSLWAMGSGINGELGTGTNHSRTSPVQIASNVIKVTAGNSHSFYLKNNGTLWAMGANNNGQLGDGTAANRLVPVQVATDVISMAAGLWHSFYVKSDETLWAMGDNAYGQLGDGTTAKQLDSVNIASNVVEVSAGTYHSHYLKEDGTLWSAGRNNYGQLGIGDGSVADRNSFSLVASGVQSIAAGGSHSLYLKTDGTVWVVGSNSSGQLGIGIGGDAVMPLILASDVRSVSSGNGQLLFITPDADLHGMGYNYYGQLGNGTTEMQTNPIKIGSGVKAVVSEANHTFYIGADGNLWAMGDNTYAQLGDGTMTSRAIPVQIANGVSAVATGRMHSLFVKSDGTLWVMGQNNAGQLGDGTMINRTSPVQVANGVISVAAGAGFSLYLKSDGTLWAMGQNNYGQLGDGTTTNRSSPVHVASDVVAVAAGYSHSLYLKGDGTLWGMGQNEIGQLGDGAVTNRTMPVLLAHDVETMSADGSSSQYLTKDGRLFVMGNNYYGQIGNGAATHSPSPVINPVLLAENVITGEDGASSHFFIQRSGSGSMPSVITSPLQQSLICGDVLQLSVVAEGSGPFDYVWRKDGQQIHGMAGRLATYYLPFAQLADAGDYDVIISNSAGTVTSEVGSVMVAPLRITGQPLGATVNAGEPAMLEVVVESNLPTTFQWQKDGAVISAATSQAYTIASTKSSEGGNYTVVVINSAGSVTSLPATLTVSTNYTAWGQEYFTPEELGNSVISGPNADPDGDDHTNLFEYALGLDPWVSDSAGTLNGSDETYWVYTYSRPTNRDGIVYAVEVSVDLANWTTDGVIHEQISSTGDTDTWHALYPFNSAPSVFFRLQITQL